MRHKQYHNRAFALGIAAIVFLSVTFSLPAQSLAERDFSRGVADSLSLSGMTTISFSERVLLHDLRMSVATLDSASVPPMDYGMTNVTVQGEGCRFLPHGTHFGGEGATVRLHYDRTRIPSGYTEEDIRTYYYDTSLERWVALERVEVDRGTATVVSRTTHFTDMVNGVIVAPETPETGAFVPTMMTDIQAADPTSRLTFIMPPTANNRGSANLQYPFEMPPARNGMQPSLALTYDSDGGSGWAGEGWDIRVPAITVDTRWGVPRYSTEFESETYLLNGQMLAMMNGNQMTVAHRQDSIPRQSERQFFVRQGGDFSKIVRHGDSPGNYWWQVTDRNGTVYTYGNTAAACVSGSYTGAGDTQPREVIAEWRLTGVKETHGDSIGYVWQAADVPLYGGTITAREVWLSEVTAKNQERTAPHTRVTFHNREQGKAMSTNSARYGFLTTSTRLLGSVDINFRADTIGDYEALRTYAMSYEEGVFHRDRLTRIDHIVAGDTVSFQTFDYYDDVRAGNGIAPFESDSTSFSDPTAVMVTAFNQPVPQGHSGHGTLLGGTFSKTYSGSLYAGVGFGATPGKSMTAGASFGYSHTSATGEAAFIDLDGDGLPDKVFKEDGVVKYSRQLITSGGTHFGAAVPLAAGEGVSLADFSRSKTSTVTGGPKAYLGYGPAFGEFGSDFMSSTTKTTHYFADVNGDGLADIVAGGKVLFNHIENGVPTFTLSSGHTPSPINNTGEIDISSLEVLNDSRDSLVSHSPMQDVVRYWEAPMAGTVNIVGSVTRLLPVGEYDHEAYGLADSLCVSIQVKQREQWRLSIAKGDTSPHATNVSNVSVQAGDKIFFRLQCGRQQYSDGSFDKVVWPVSVSYVTDNLLDSEPNGHSLHFYSPEEDNVPLVGTELPADTASITIFNTYSKPATSDDVTLTIRYTGHTALAQPTYGEWTREASDTTAVWSMTLGRLQEVAAENVPLAVPAVFNDGLFSFEVSSTSNVRWEDVSWRPSLRYVHDLGTRLDTSIVAANPQYKIFNKLVKAGTMFTNGNTPVTSITVTLSVTPHMRSGSYEVLTLKNCNDLIAKIPLSQPFSQHTYAVDIPAGESVCAEFFADYQINPSQINAATVQFGQNGPEIPASVYSMDPGADLGPTHRGWGQFVYNARGNRYARPIATDSLSMPRDSLLFSPLDISVSPLTAKNGDPTWLVGAKTDIFIHGDTLSTARLADNHVDPLPLFGELATVSGAQEGMDLKGTAARGLTLVSQANSDDGIISAGAFGVGFSHNDATGRGVNKNAFIDMNGDGYPDIVTEGSIQYTNTLGGFANGGSLDRSTMQLDVSEQGMFSDNGASSNGYGGGPVHSFSINRSGGTGAVSQANASVAASINGTASENWDKMRFNYLDINGDGLPDMLSTHNDSSLHVRLNLGYGFTDEFCLSGVTQFQRTVTGTLSASLSGSFNIDASSFAGGMGVSTSTSRLSHTLMDVNGDGLPDMVWMDGCMKVRLNLGDSFASEELEWNGARNIGETGATTLSLNTSYTYSNTFPPGIKIAVTPGMNMAWGMTRPEMELRDIDGDGFIDILESDGENDLRVRRSTIRRTNRLRSVTNSLGGKFEIDYEHSTPTYGLPGGKWVMSSVTVDRGIHGNDYDIPNTRQTFDYANGVRDRHEREFLGFHEVTTWQVDPGNGNAPLRQTVEVYDTASVYTAGSLLLTYVADPQGNRYGETRNTYYTYALTNDCDNSAYNGGRFSFSTANYRKWNDRGAAYCPVRFTETRRYEGESAAAVMSQDWYQYYDRRGDHGLLRKVRHTVGGGLNANGAGTYDRQTNVEYSDSLSGTAHIFGLPKRVKVTDKRGNLYHLTEATYNLNHSNQITQIKRMLSYDVATPVGGGAGPIGRGDGTGTGTNGIGDGIGGGTITPIGRNNPDQESSIYTETYLNPVYAITDYTYDRYGNLHTVRLPDNGSNQRMTYTYTYDGLQNMHLVDVQDSLNFSSTFGTLDYRFGIARSHNDINNARTYSYVDNLGRVTGINFPNELQLFANSGQYSETHPAYYTIAFEYEPKADIDAVTGHITRPAYAITKRLNNGDELSNPQYVESITFVDGFGRPVQVKKQSVIESVYITVEPVYVVSGHQVYDGYGRVIESYHPTTDPPAQRLVFHKTPDAVQPTVTQYDAFDRPVSITHHDGTVTSYSYDVNPSEHTEVTTTTDANQHQSKVYTDGDGRTVKTVQYKDEGNSQALTTTFAYDGIGRLTTVTDTEGNVTSSTYDLGDRRTSVEHPASGISSFTYAPAGNMLTKRTANMQGTGKAIRYSYNYHQLDTIFYPDHPENNVYYFYGTSQDVTGGWKGRVKLRVDGTGATEYTYGNLGEVTSERRTVVVPNQHVATFNTSWNYDSQGRLHSMTYPDEITVTYGYDAGGNLNRVSGSDGSHNCDYVQDIHYDKFGDRVRIYYGNGFKTAYFYNAKNRRMNRIYTTSSTRARIALRSFGFDNVGNITSVSTSSSNMLLPSMRHTYVYDALNRLVEAHGQGLNNSSNSYDLTMDYDDLYRVTSKHQLIQQDSVQFAGKLFAGYNLDYAYNQVAGKKFQMSTVSDTNYRTALVAPTANDSIREAHSYEYDNNGNILYVNTLRLKPDMTAQPDTVQRSREERFRWDEENRLTALSQNGYVSNYWYDANGDRVIKEHGENMAVFVNGRQDGCVTQTGRYSVYPNPYYSYGDDGRYTKHIYIGSERVLSQVGGVYGEPRILDVAGHDVRIKVDYPQIRASQDSVMEAAYTHFDLPYNGTDHDNFGRYKFDLPGYWNESLQSPRDGEEEGDEGTPARAQELLYYYHTDHLGSSTLVTDGNGDISQQIEYLPYGEVFLEKQSTTYATPYKFNGKELDEETGLYYYGARYMNPRFSIWYGCDPLGEKYPNVSCYNYCHSNPITRLDEDGMDDWEINSLGYVVKRIENKRRDAFYIVDYKGRRIKGKKLVFTYRTIESATGQKTDAGTLYDVYKLHNDAKGTQLFEFLAQNTDVEWSQLKLGIAGKNGLNFILTSHGKDSESGSIDLINKQLCYGYTIREDIHSHPGNTPYPSGMNNSSGDIQYAKSVVAVMKQKPVFNIFLPRKKKYVSYSSHSIPEDFGFKLEVSLNEVVVTGSNMKK